MADVHLFRNGVLDDLRQWEESGVVETVEWLTAQDDAVCELCAARNGKRFSIKEARALLQAGSYCRPVEADMTCRCTLLPNVSEE